MKLLNVALLTFALTLVSLSARADFMNMATLSVNGNTVRRIIDNSKDPHPINLSKYKVGDTLHIDLWTDHGAENNAFVQIHDLETDRVQKLARTNTLIITSDFLNHEQLISATFIYERRNEEFQVTSNLFQTTLSNQIELLHQSLEDFSKLLVDAQSNKSKLTLEILSDSIEVNFIPHPKSKARKLSDTTFQSKRLEQFLQLNETEIDYFEGFSGVDYFTIYSLGSDLYGDLKIDNDNLDEYQFTLGDWEYRVEFYFSFTGTKYKLNKILLQLKE